MTNIDKQTEDNFQERIIEMAKALSDLQVLTNKVLLDFETKQSTSLGRGFNGVLFSWTVSLNNYNKWINSL